MPKKAKKSCIYHSSKKSSFTAGSVLDIGALALVVIRLADRHTASVLQQKLIPVHGLYAGKTHCKAPMRTYKILSRQQLHEAGEGVRFDPCH